MSAVNKSGAAWLGLIGNIYTINLYCSWKLKPAKPGWGCGLTETQCRPGFIAMGGRDFPNPTRIPTPPQRLPHPLDFLAEVNEPAKKCLRATKPNIIYPGADRHDWTEIRMGCLVKAYAAIVDDESDIITILSLQS
jgi:hypothetical protein